MTHWNNSLISPCCEELPNQLGAEPPPSVVPFHLFLDRLFVAWTVAVCSGKDVAGPVSLVLCGGSKNCLV